MKAGNINNTPDWQNLEVLSRNRLKPRASFLPYANYAENKGNILDTAASSRVTNLNGEWFFKYYPEFSEVESGIERADCAGYDRVNVPSCWQYTGYEKPFYLNVPFPIPALPPLVPNNNPVGVYRKKFNFDLAAFQRDYSAAVLTFEGVCAAFDVYFNGEYIGYSQGSHMPSEFDIAPYFKDGENDLCVLVYKWCDGSYLECQDMFRNNGIFRDVYFTVHKRAYIWDAHFKTRRSGGGFDAVLNVETRLSGEAELRAELIGKDGTVFQKTIAAEENTELRFFVENPLLWSAERPSLYTLSLSLFCGGEETENVALKVGFKEITIENGVFKVNDVPIKCKGVNHHDTSLTNGCAMTYEEMKRDILLMKEYNINTVRFSHYPPSSKLMRLCDELGLYAVDEADIESHGALFMEEGGSYFSEDERWAKSFLDRVERMYYRDRNHPSVIMWSLGNESGLIKNHQTCFEFLKRVDPETPVHYEGLYPLTGQYGFDVITFMYPTIEVFRQMVGEKNTGRPFFMCEYCHAMGVGPGSLKEYWEEIYGSEKAMGGCVWEWAEHGFLSDNGIYRYGYGGDSGEYIHDGNFCVDGMMSGDRTPTPSAYAVKNAYRPVVSSYENGKLIFYNTQSFTDTSALIFRFSYLVGGEVVKAEEKRICLNPLEKRAYEIAETGGNDALLTIEYIGCDDGKSVGIEQHELTPFKAFSQDFSGKKPVVSENEKQLLIKAGDCEIVFSKGSANITSYRFKGNELFNESPANGGYNPFSRPLKGFLPGIYRFGIDNDMYLKNDWEKAYYHMEWMHIESFSVKNAGNRVEISVKSILSPPKVSKQFDQTVCFSIGGNGSIGVKCTLIPARDGLPFLPRYGVRAELSPTFCEAEWYGRGPHENYCDMTDGEAVGIYRAKVEDLYYPNVKPQESGNRGGVRRVKMIDKVRKLALCVSASENPLNFNARHFVTEDLINARHREDIPPHETTELCIDGFFSGIGSNSCGPKPLEKYLVQADQPISFGFILHAEDLI